MTLSDIDELVSSSVQSWKALKMFRLAPRLRSRVVAITLSVAAIALLATTTLLAQSTAFPAALERLIWKDLGPWTPLVNNTPSSADEVVIDEGTGQPQLDIFGNPVYASPFDNFADEFAALQTGECTFSAFGDWDTYGVAFVDYPFDGPKQRRCKAANGAEEAPPTGTLLYPVGLAVDGTRVYVSDMFNHRVQVFDFFGRSVELAYPIGNGQNGIGPYTDPNGQTGEKLDAPEGIAVDAAQRIAVADGWNKRIAVFNSDGSKAFEHALEPWIADEMKPSTIALTPGATLLPDSAAEPIGPAADHRVVVTDWTACQIHIMNTRFRVIKSLPEVIPASPQKPNNACWDPDSGHVTEPGEFSTVTGVTVDAQSRIYITDHAQNVVQVFDRDGNHLGWIGRPGQQPAPGELLGPVGLTFDHLGRLGVIDGGNARVVFYSLAFHPTTGVPTATFEFQLDTTASVDDFPMGLVEMVGPSPADDTGTPFDESTLNDPKGRFVVTDPLKRRVLRFELPELAIVNASMSGGVGRFDVVVPKQKVSAVLGVTVTADVVESATLTSAPVPSSAQTIPGGRLVSYTFGYSATGAVPTFRLNARGDFNVPAGRHLAVADEVIVDGSGQAASTVQYGGGVVVDYGDALSLVAAVGPATATGSVRFTFGPYVVTAPITSVVAGFARAEASIPSVIRDVAAYPMSVEYLGDASNAPSTTTAFITVRRRSVAVAADTKFKLSGAADPALTYQIIGGTLLSGDAFSGSLVRDAGEAVSSPTVSYQIRQGSLALGPNYSISYVPATFTIFANVISVQAQPGTKRFGAAEPALTFKALASDGSEIPVGSLPFTGSLQRDAGETVAGYRIRQGTLALPAGYQLLYFDNLFWITQAQVDVIPAAQSKIYGAANPAFTFAYGAFPSGYSAASVTTAPTCAVAGPHVVVGSYAITCSGGAIDINVGFNYLASMLTITPKAASLAIAPASREYTAANPAFTATASGLINGDTLAYTLASAATTTTGVGNYPIVATLGSNPNYTVSAPNGTLSIVPKPITVAATNASKFIGQLDPAFGYTITAGGPLLAGNGFTGALTRDAGELVGGYTIRQGTLSAAPNYTIASFTTGTLSILANLAPVALPDVATSTGLAVTIAVLSNDTDANGDTLSIASFTQPTGGTVTASGTQLVFTPTPGFSGVATFNYTVTDGRGGNTTALVTVTVTASVCSLNGFTTYTQGGWGATPNGANPAMLLQNRFGQVYQSGAVTIGGARKLTFNSSAAINAFLPAGGSPSILSTSATNPTSSSAGVFAGQVLALQLNVDFSAAGVTKPGLGSLLFSGYPVNQVLAVANDVLGGNTAVLSQYGLSISQLNAIVDAINNNFDDGDDNDGVLSCPVVTTCGPSAITLSGNSSTSGTAGNIRSFSSGDVSVRASAFSRTKSSQTWSTAFLGAFSSGLGVTDGSEGSGSGDSHKVDNLGDRQNYILFEFSKPVVITRAFLDYVSTDSDATVWIGTKSDPFNNHLTLSDTLLNSLAKETSTTTSNDDRWATFNGGAVTANVLVIAADVDDTSPEDSFKISKLTLGCSGGAANVAPTLTASNRTNVRGTALNVTVAGSDADGDTLTYAATGLPTGLGISSSTGAITGTPTASGSFNVTVTVTDPSNASASASFVWTITNPTNRAPDAVNDSASVYKGKNKTIAVRSNDTDPDGDALTITSVTQPSQGSVTIQSNGTIQYRTPSKKWTGQTTFTYTISDGRGGTDTATVTVTASGSHKDDDGCDH